MLTSILGLFGKSPFAPLQSHMNKVSDCVHLLKNLFNAIQAKNYAEAGKIAAKISELEHEADITKNGIRNHLPKSLFLPIDRSQLLQILAIQDNIADSAEDVAVLTGLKKIELLDSFKEEFSLFLDKNIETFEGARQIIKEMHDLLESSFGGIEAEKVCVLVDRVAFLEHEADIIQRRLLRKIFDAEKEMSYTTFHVWQKILEAISSVSNLSENLANRVRMMLELK